MSNENKLLVSDIQRFCTHDGPGVRTVVFLKGCPLRCPWCANPESLEARQELYYIKNKCIACGECIKACPEHCISVTDKHVVVERDTCTHCFLCTGVCPATALQIKGRWYTADELVEQVLKDQEFFDRSGGGLTLSGGEVLAQAAAAEILLRRIKQLGIHCAIETSGFARWKNLGRILPFCDLVYYDIKMADAERHLSVTGQDNKIILNNLFAAVKEGANIVIRLPMIPGRNMDDDNINALIKMLLPYNLPVEPLVFHQLGKNKYSAVGKPYEMENAAVSKKEDLASIAERLKRAGLKVIL
ncbi:MAG: glycyl-radical enzyme activating protein [Treponema sp.]|jgi:pyruvate formate lyase activating enzyme|nr:glycyl-radical enzyme activating protein [Treponema sp.]